MDVDGDFLALFDGTPLQGRVDLASRAWLLATVPGGGLRMSEGGTAKLEFEGAQEEGYRSRDGVELPRTELRVTRVEGERLTEAVRIRDRWGHPA